MRIGANTFRWSVGLRRVSCFFDKSSPHGICENLRDLWENIPVPHAPFRIPYQSFRIPHSTFSPSTSNIPQSQHSSPKSTRFFPLRPAPRPNTPFSACYCNRLTFSHLSSEDPRATFQTHHSPPRNAIFRPSIPALSRLHPLPFAPRSLSPRNPIHA